MAMIIQEQSDYEAFVAQYQQAKSGNRQNADIKRDLRKKAQAGLSKARMLEKTFLNYRTIAEKDNNKKDIEFFNEKIKHIQDHIKWWTSECQLLGSSLTDLPSTTFDDIVGMEDIKESIRDYLFVLRNPDVASAYRIGTNMGILLYGPPGTGKTMFAEAIANELDVRFFVITPANIKNSLVGESEKNVQDLFDELRACTDGSVLLIDECESIFCKRGSKEAEHMTGVTNQLLQEMNGQGDLASSKRVIVGATNCPELIDDAYLRYKRFSMQYLIDVPNNQAKELVINKKLGKMGDTVSPEFKDMLLDFARTHNTITCADINGIIEQAAFLAVRDMRRISQGGSQQRTRLSAKHFEAVIAKYNLSVTPEKRQHYLDFQAERQKTI